MESHTLQIPPFYVEVDGVRVQILESSKHTLLTGETWYIVSCRIIYKGITSKIFPLFVRNEEDLVNKLKIEITKIKFLDYAYGLEEVRKVIA